MAPWASHLTSCTLVLLDIVQLLPVFSFVEVISLMLTCIIVIKVPILLFASRTLYASLVDSDSGKYQKSKILNPLRTDKLPQSWTLLQRHLFVASY